MVKIGRELCRPYQLAMDAPIIKDLHRNYPAGWVRRVAAAWTALAVPVHRVHPLHPAALLTLILIAILSFRAISTTISHSAKLVKALVPIFIVYFFGLTAWTYNCIRNVTKFEMIFLITRMVSIRCIFARNPNVKHQHRNPTCSKCGTNIAALWSDATAVRWWPGGEAAGRSIICPEAVGRPFRAIIVYHRHFTTVKRRRLPIRLRWPWPLNVWRNWQVNQITRILWFQA